jgi:putative MATE family efflux protein
LSTAAANADTRLIEGPVGRALFVFAMPTLASNVLQSLNGSINAFWIGRLLGARALASTTNTNIIMFVLSSLVFGIGMAATVMIAQRMGAKDADGARRVMGSAIGVSLAASCVVFLAGWLCAPWLLRALDTPAEAYPLALSYLRIIFVAMPWILTSTMVITGLRGAGDAATPFKLMAVNVVLDAGLNPLLIRGIGPIPAMGIAGSATATAIAAAISLGLLIAEIYRRDLPLRLRGRELAYLLPSAPQVRLLVAKGMPMGLQMVVTSAAGLIMLGLVNREGLLTVAAYGACQQLWIYVQMPSMAIGAAVSAMAAQNVGAGRWARVERINGAGLVCNGLFTGGSILLLLLLSGPTLGLFLPHDAAAIAIGAHVQMIVSWSFLFYGLSMVLFSTMRATGVVMLPLLIMFVALFPIRFGFYFAAYGAIGAEALWLSFPIGSLAALAMAAWLYARGGWRRGALMPVIDAETLIEQANASAEPAGRNAPVG